MSTAIKSHWKEVPDTPRSTSVLRLVHADKIDAEYLSLLKQVSQFSDQAISDFLHINVKTYRNYRDSTGKPFGRDIQEHILMLLSLLKHGIEVFGDSGRFDDWLNQPNFHFDKQKPSMYLETISGIRFIDDRLTGMEYGDNA